MEGYPCSFGLAGVSRLNYLLDGASQLFFLAFSCGSVLATDTVR